MSLAASHSDVKASLAPLFCWLHPPVGKNLEKNSAIGLVVIDNQNRYVGQLDGVFATDGVGNWKRDGEMKRAATAGFAVDFDAPAH